MPVAQEKIYVRFNLSDRMVWWETTIKTVCHVHRDSSDKPVRVLAEVLYSELADYEEVSATVAFVGRKTIEHLDDRHRKISTSTWTRDEVLATLDTCESADSEDHSDDGNWSDSSIRPTPNNHGVIPTSADTDSSKGMLTTLRGYFVCLRNRMASMELKLHHVTRCNHEEAWESRISALRMTLKYKLLEALRRPIRKHKVKDPKPFQSIISDSAIHVSTDCDAELLHHVLQDFSHKYFSNLNDVSGAWIHPRSYHVLHQDFSKQPVAMVFATFNNLASWLGISSQEDIHSMVYRTTSTPHHTFIQLLGTMQLSEGDESKPLNVFIGRSSSKCNITDTDVRFGCDCAACVSIPNMAWDAENMNFVRQWYSSLDFPAMETLGDTNFEDFTCFSVKWSAYDYCIRRTLSAETRYLGGNPLGKLTVFIPVVQFHGPTAVSISDIVSDLEEYV